MEPGHQPRAAVTFVEYGSESDAGFGGENGYPIPEAAKTTASDFDVIQLGWR